MRWKDVTRSNRCPACGSDTWCALSEDGAWLLCRRSDHGPLGKGATKTDREQIAYWVHRLVEGAKFEADPEPPKPQHERADAATLHRIYSALLEELTLSSEHLAQLAGRGITEEEVRRRGYRTVPGRTRSAIVKRFRERFGDETLLRVPGFYLKQDDERRWLTLGGSPGIYIPVRDTCQRIVALRVRADDAAYGKYLWLTSDKEKRGFGPSPGAPVHVPLPLEDPRTRVPADSQDQPPVQCTSGATLPHSVPATVTAVRITEGELKADVCILYDSTPTISIPGVAHWEKALPVLQEFGATVALLAFDQDAQQKPSVAQALRDAAAGLTRAGLEVRIETWPLERGKGIDDLLSDGNKPSVITGSAVEAHVENTASAAGLPSEPRVLMEALRNGKDPVAYMAAPALAAAAVVYANHHEDWMRTKLAAKSAGVDVRRWEQLVKGEKKPALRSVESGEGIRLRPVVEALTDPPVAEDLMVPSGWQVSERDGVVQQHEGRQVTASSAPILVTGRLHDISDGTEALRLAWWRDGAWQQHTVDRLTAADARALVSLSSRGLPVTSLSAGDVVRYLSDFEAVNLAVLPRARVARQMGWQDKGKLGFLWGRSLITEGGQVEGAVDSTDPRSWAREGVWFRGGDEGEEQFAEGLVAQGSFTKWAEAAAKCVPYPRVLLALYAALAAPMLTVLEQGNFCVDWSFSTSTGKTTTLRLAASCWGLPDEREPAAALTTWHNSRVFLERASSVLSGMPLIVDDTKTAKKREDVGSAIYDVCSGRGRGRGSLKGMRRTASWRTVLLSSGEQPLTSFSQDGGAVARVLTIWGLPFGRDDIGQEVQAIDTALRRNYGHAGPRFVQWLLQNREKWKSYRDTRDIYQDRLLERCVSPVAGRLAGHAAVIELTAYLAHQALDLPWGLPDFDKLWDEVLVEAKDQDPPTAALSAVMSWARANSHTFWGRHEVRKPMVVSGVVTDTKDPVIPHGGWSGAWNPGDDWSEICIAPHRLSQLLEQAGHDADSILRTWRDRGWIKLGTEKKRLTRKVRVQSVLNWLVCIKHSAVEGIQGKEEEEKDA